LSQRDLNILVKYLSRDKHAAVVDAEVIKFVEPDSPESSSAITEPERGIAELRAAVQRVEAQVGESQRKIEERTRKINEALHTKRRDEALIYLRLRKHLEKQLSQRLGVLENLHSMLTEVDMAATNIETMKAYELSSNTLKSILSHPSLQRDKVEETLNAMTAATDEHHIISDEIKFALESTQQTTVDEDEIAAELANLLKDVKAEEEAKARKAEEAKEEELAQKLPSVPAGKMEDATPASQEDISKSSIRSSDEAVTDDAVRGEKTGSVLAS